MRMLHVVLIAGMAGLAGRAAAQEPSLAGGTLERYDASAGLDRAITELSRGQREAFWAGYAAPLTPGDHRMCCWDSIESFRGAGRGRDGGCCRLEETTSFNIGRGDDETAALEGPRRFFVLVRVAKGAVGKIRTFTPDCDLDPGGRPLFWLTGVSPAGSLAWLATHVTGGTDETEHALAAIALHDDPEADRLLERFATAGHPKEVREHALFWLGVERGRSGFEVLRRAARDDPQPGIRSKAIFGLSQSKVEGAIEEILRAAHADRSGEVRGEAVFWLAQAAGSKAAAAITDAIENDPETEVKKKAVFALSQLPAEEGVPLLIGLARRHRNPVVRKEAVFWLGQSDDPRALAFIEEILRS